MLNNLIENITDYDKIAEEAVKDIDVTAAGSCMEANEAITKAFVANDIDNFKVVEGWVSLYNRADKPTHTWIELEDGTIIDKTLSQFEAEGVSKEDLKNLEYSSIRQKYTPEEYLELCEEYPK